MFIVLLASAFSLFGQAKRRISDLDAPTPVQPGVMSQRQREHSKIYADASGLGSIETELKERGEVSMATQSCGGSGMGDPETPDEIMHRQVCSASAIVVGTAVSKESQLNSNGNWIFTDYTFHVEKVLKNDKDSTIKTGSDVIVTMTGGKISIDGRIATATDYDYKFLNASDLYIFFLNRIPSTGAYTILSGSEYVSAADGKLNSLGGLFIDTNQTPMAYLELIRLAAKTPCVSPKQ